MPWCSSPATSPPTPKLGIDLQGGTRVTLTARTPDGSEPSQDSLQAGAGDHRDPCQRSRRVRLRGRHRRRQPRHHRPRRRQRAGAFARPDGASVHPPGARRPRGRGPLPAPAAAPAAGGRNPGPDAPAPEPGDEPAPQNRPFPAQDPTTSARADPGAGAQRRLRARRVTAPTGAQQHEIAAAQATPSEHRPGRAAAGHGDTRLHRSPTRCAATTTRPCRSSRARTDGQARLPARPERSSTARRSPTRRRSSTRSSRATR